MKNVAIVIPVYKEQLEPREHFAITHALQVARNHDIIFIGPERLQLDALSPTLGSYPYMAFADTCFQSVHGYSRLLLSASFYQRFHAYEFILVLQPDAILLRDELDYWCSQAFDYIGAPWPDGYELFVNIGPFEGDKGKKVKVHVGNGGLSLRRVKKCIHLLEEFSDAVAVFDRTGSSEDLFFSVMGALSNDFIIPNEITASRFSMELRPSYYYAVNGGHIPMGGHAWSKYDPGFWRSHLPNLPP